MIAWGLPPTGIVAITLSVLGSIRLIVPSPLLATQTEPAPTAMPAGEGPTGIVVTTDRPAGSIRLTVSSSESATHTPPAPTAIPLGPLPTAIGVDRPVGSTRVTLFASESVSQMAPSPIAIAVGAEFGSIALTDLAGRRVKACQQTRPGRDPHPVALRRNRRGAARHDGVHLRVGPTSSNCGSIRLTDTLLA